MKPKKSEGIPQTMVNFCRTKPVSGAPIICFQAEGHIPVEMASIPGRHTYADARANTVAAGTTGIMTKVVGRTLSFR
jgi:hypothetical protein